MLEALVFTFFIELGWIPDQGIILPETETYINDIYYVEFNSYFQYSIIWAQVGIRVYAYPWGWEKLRPQFWPVRFDFNISTGITLGIVTIGVRHLCVHTVDSFSRVTDPLDGFYDEIFLRVSNEK